MGRQWKQGKELRGIPRGARNDGVISVPCLYWTREMWCPWFWLPFTDHPMARIVLKAFHSLYHLPLQEAGSVTYFPDETSKALRI